MEPVDDNLYSSAILIDSNGNILFKHRKVKEGKPYSCGETFNVVQAVFGTVMFAVCADVWADELISDIAKYHPEYIIVPADICGEDDELGLINFDRRPDKLEELKEQYAKISNITGSKVLAVNCYCKDTSEYCCGFGGAFVFDNGVEIPSLDLHAGQWRQPIEQPIYNFVV